MALRCAPADSRPSILQTRRGTNDCRGAEPGGACARSLCPGAEETGKRGSPAVAAWTAGVAAGGARLKVR